MILLLCMGGLFLYTNSMPSIRCLVSIARHLVLISGPVPRLRLGPCAVTLPARFPVRLGRSVPKFAALICGLKRPTHDAPLAGWGKVLWINDLLEVGPCWRRRTDRAQGWRKSLIQRRERRPRLWPNGV